MKTQINLI